MKKLATLGAVVLMLVLGLAPAHGTERTAEDERRGRPETVTLCLSLRLVPELERTVSVPEPAARALLGVTASYEGPCAEYGESAPRGNAR